MLSLTDKWKATYPGAGVGILKMGGVANPESSSDLDEHTSQIEQDLRTRYSGADRATIKTIPSVQAYNAFYKRFKKTYHVQLQLESVILKNRPIPGMRALVKAMVTSELKNQLLTAGHDVEMLEGSLTADVASGEETYTRYGGQEQQLKQGDMFIADSTEIISSVIYGPDARTSIREDTGHVCFTVYAVQGIAATTVKSHLEDIRDGVLLVSPHAEVELLEVCM
jgi:DNA/RNA-binding domain of Phe-tRNA-synthetase-like protein